MSEFDVLEMVSDGSLIAKNTEWISKEGKEAVTKLIRVMQKRPRSVVEELRIYRQYVPVLLRVVFAAGDVNKGLIKQQERYAGAEAEKSHKRWTPEDDETLIDLVCREDTNIHEISVIFGRTPAAIQRRVTYLVGLKRLSQAVAGRFVGTVDGVQTESEIQGVVYREG